MAGGVPLTVKSISLPLAYPSSGLPSSGLPSLIVQLRTKAITGRTGWMDGHNLHLMLEKLTLTTHHHTPPHLTRPQKSSCGDVYIFFVLFPQLFSFFFSFFFPPILVSCHFFFLFLSFFHFFFPITRFWKRPPHYISFYI